MKRVIISMMILGSTVFLSSCATQNPNQSADAPSYSLSQGPPNPAVQDDSQLNQWPLAFTINR